MAHYRHSDKTEMDDFINDDCDGSDSQDTWAYAPSSPTVTPLTPSVNRPRGSLLNPDNRRRQRVRPVAPTSSVDSRSEDIESEMAAIDQSPARVPVTGSQTPSVRSLRETAVNAYSPIRKHARMDLGYISDIAEADDSDEPDELDAESHTYAPLATQAELDLEDDAWVDIPDCEDVGSLNGNVTITSDRFVELGHTIKEDGYIPLIHEALTAEHESGSKLGGFYHDKASDFWEAMSMTTLCSMPGRVVEELICGNLKQAYDSDEQLREQLDGFRERGKHHPCIYARSLTTATGDTMTISDARRLAKWLQRYVNESPDIVGHPRCVEAFHRIDDQFRGQWKRVNPEAARVFLASTKQARIQSRVESVLLFSRQLIARCKISEQKGTPLKPLVYVGYAARADQRKRQHEACGKSSNWLATLVQAICNVLWGQGQFQMHFMVICMLAFEGQGMVAEMLLTRISGAYYNLGGGFCIDVAGKSMESLYFESLTHEQIIDKWNELSGWVSANTPLEANKSECVRRTHEKQMRQTAATIAQTESVKTQMKQQLAETRKTVAYWTDALKRFPDDPSLQTDEVKLFVAKAVRDLAEMEEVVAGACPE